MAQKEFNGDDKFEVYVLLKEVGQTNYTPHADVSHYICFLKGKTTCRTYYTELQNENGGDFGGQIRIDFKENYQFYDPPIYYVPIGETSIELEKMRQYAQYDNDMIGKEYNIAFFNCQTWVSKFIKFIGITSEINNSHILNWNGLDALGKIKCVLFKFNKPVALLFAFVLKASDIKRCEHPSQMKISKIGWVCRKTIEIMVFMGIKYGAFPKKN